MNYQFLKTVSDLLADTNIKCVRIRATIYHESLRGKIEMYNSNMEHLKDVPLSIVSFTELIDLWNEAIRDPDVRLHLDLRPAAIVSIENATILNNIRFEISSPDLSSTQVLSWLSNASEISQALRLQDKSQVFYPAVSIVCSRLDDTRVEQAPKIATKEPDNVPENTTRNEASNEALNRVVKSIAQNLKDTHMTDPTPETEEVKVPDPGVRKGSRTAEQRERFLEEMRNRAQAGLIETVKDLNLPNPEEKYRHEAALDGAITSEEQTTNNLLDAVTNGAQRHKFKPTNLYKDEPLVLQ